MNAIILAGGKGSRLAPWHAPKCLLPIGGITILQRLLRHLLVVHEEIVDRVIVCSGYRDAEVKASISEHGWQPTVVLCSFAGEDAPMGARLLQAQPMTNSKRVLICYGDELADVDLRRLIAVHENNRYRMTFATVPASIPGGTVLQNEVTGRLAIVEDERRLVNIGFVLVEPDCWTQLRGEDGLSHWITRVSQSVDEKCHDEFVGPYLHDGKRATINSLADLPIAEELWR